MKYIEGFGVSLAKKYGLTRECSRANHSVWKVALVLAVNLPLFPTTIQFSLRLRMVYDSRERESTNISGMLTMNYYTN